MLTIVYVQEKNKPTEQLYIDVTNADWDIEKVYNHNFEKYLINPSLYNQIKNMIIQKVTYNYPKETQTPDTYIKIGNSIKTPQFLKQTDGE